jgi:serine protease Do
VFEEIERLVADVAERIGPGVVGLGRGWRPGSGIVVADGHVLTNAHNLRGEETSVTFGDGRAENAVVAGVDQALDLAVLRVETGSVEPVEWAADDATAAIGTAVVALADPGGRGLRATLGFVSAANRSFRGPGGRRITGCIEHTAALPRGSSGGPLVDRSGRLLGINSIRLEGGLIVAIPADSTTRERYEALARGEASAPARLGVAVAPPYAARRLRRAVGLPEREGVLVRSVADGGPAAVAGVRRGDLIVSAGGVEVDGIDPLYEALDAAGKSGGIELTVLRGSDELKLPVSFERAKEEAK